MAGENPYLKELSLKLTEERRALKSNPSYSGFDYRKAYGESPFLNGADRLGRTIDQLYGNYGTGTDGAGGLLGFSSAHVARPNDPEVRDYMANVMGGERNALDDYVRRAAGAGIRRGGMNVAGGPGLDSSLHQQAMKSLASGYSDRFTKAMDYNKYVKSTQYARSAEALSNLQNLLDLQHRYVTGQAGWQSRVGDKMHEDWQGDVTWRRANPERELAQERVLQQMGLERDSAQLDADLRRRQRNAAPRGTPIFSPRRGVLVASNQQIDSAKTAQMDLANQRQRTELDLLRQELEKARKQTAWAAEDRSQALGEKSQREMNWRQLVHRAGLASAQGSYDPALRGEDALWADRLGVELGYLKPWQRSLQLKTSGGGRSGGSGTSQQSETSDRG